MSHTTSRPVHIAIVGAGLIGPRHAEAVRAHPHASLACIVDPNPSAISVAENLGCPLYESTEQLFSHSDQVDGAIVCTPNHTHVAISKALLKGGIHVLCEKPLAVDVQSGKELVCLAYCHRSVLF